MDKDTDQMLTATFSTGFKDAYKGSRDVKAAWAIIHTETGKVLKSGHSLDAVKARKTAEGNLQYVEVFSDENPLRFLMGVLPHSPSSVKRAIREHNAARLDFIRSVVTVEIVEL